MGRDMQYDIRTPEYAMETLERLTGVPERIWEQCFVDEKKYQYPEDFVEAVVRNYGNMPQTYTDFEFIFFHITTSSKGCEAIRKDGILDLQNAYKNMDSELGVFLEERGIIIDIERQLLLYGGREYDISYGKRPRQGTEEYNCWSIGYKFYYDYTVCGFLSVEERSPYGGRVHLRPEILLDIDNLLELGLSYEWEQEHEAYEVVARVSGDKIIYSGYDEQTDEEKVINYLTMAYMTAFYGTREREVLLKNGVQISPDKVMEIRPLSHWKGKR